MSHMWPFMVPLLHEILAFEIFIYFTHVVSVISDSHSASSESPMETAASDLW
jgi:hypothetical protein